MKKVLIVSLILLAIVIVGCAKKSVEPSKSTDNGNAPVSMANPASQNCEKVGGRLSIMKRGDGGEYGVCLFEDNRQCEEWTLMRGDCPVGGLKITGYITPAAQYCAITGGEYAITDGKAEIEQGTCKLKGGKMCDVWDLFNGKCADGVTEIKIENKLVKEEGKTFIINVNYPIGINSLFDKVIADFVNERTIAFKAGIEGEPLMVPDVNYEMNIDYDYFRTDKTLSIKFYYYDYTGGAHPNWSVYTYNFDLEKNIDLKLADIFRTNDYLSTLSSLATTDLRQKLITPDLPQDSKTFLEGMIKDGAGPLDSNFKNFVFTKDGLLIYYNDYQIAPHSYGEQQTLILWATIDNILKDNYKNLNFDEKMYNRCDVQTVDQCSADCVVCPPCAECSSLSCQKENICRDLGFDKDWYQKMKTQ